MHLNIAQNWRICLQLLLASPAEFLLVSGDCGKANKSPGGRIIGGVDYTPNQFPWLALLQLNGTFICGGSLISDAYVLTAAHCWHSRFQQSLLKVVLGKHDRCEADNTSSSLSVEKIMVHSRFDKRNYSADLMLLKMSMSVKFNRNVRPICLPRFDIRSVVPSKFEGETATVLGWGKQHSTALNASCLPKALQLPVLKARDCKSRSSSLFCAGYIEGGKDSCQGDSGGPLQFLNIRNRYELIGVVSSGVGCALPGHPGLYTDVIRYLPWLWKRISDEHTFHNLH